MDKGQKALLVRAWRKHGLILQELRDLAEMNVSLAYGCIRTAESMIDMIMIRQSKQPDPSKGQEKEQA